MLAYANQKTMCRKEKLNEYFSEFSDIILPIFLNKIFESGILPASWSKAVIIPLNKKGNTNDPGNYRGISITSSLGKIFTSILNRSLMEWISTWPLHYRRNLCITKSQIPKFKRQTTPVLLFY